MWGCLGLGDLLRRPQLPVENWWLTQDSSSISEHSYTADDMSFWMYRYAVSVGESLNMFTLFTTTTLGLTLTSHPSLAAAFVSSGSAQQDLLRPFISEMAPPEASRVLGEDEEEAAGGWGEEGALKSDKVKRVRTSRELLEYRLFLVLLAGYTSTGNHSYVIPKHVARHI